jgi:branched-subunit amino acid transport protein AzlD
MASQSYYLEFFILVMAAATFATRLLPFIFFAKMKENDVLIFVGRYLPLMIMPILIIYSFKDISFSSVKNALPEVVASVAVAAIHIWRANSLLSISIGTSVFIWMKHYSSL